MSEFTMPHKYAIGDLLVHRITIAALEASPDIKCCPLMVTERVVQECPGGVQLKYAVTGNGGGDTLLEHEVAPWAEYVAAAAEALKVKDLAERVARLASLMREEKL